jgi:hypothetical protein
LDQTDPKRSCLHEEALDLWKDVMLHTPALTPDLAKLFQHWLAFRANGYCLHHHYAL